MTIRDHVQDKSCDGDCGGMCALCTLFVCAVCRGYEGGLATECPGVVITEKQGDAIYAGTLDFVNGEWREK